MADLSNLSTEELMRMRGETSATSGVDLSKISTEDLMKMKASPPGLMERAWGGIKDAGERSLAAKPLTNIGAGLARGAKDVIDTGAKALVSGFDKLAGTSEAERVQAMNEAGKAQFEQEHGDSALASGGRLAGQVAATAPVGGVMAGGVTAAAKIAPVLAKYAPKLAAALESGGFRLGGAPAASLGEKAVNAATRVGAGAAVGGASAGLVSSEDAGTGAALGAVLPGAAKAAGMAGKAIAANVSPEVQALYQKAKDLGINVPADRIVNSKPLNALAASLNYVPMSGRAGTEEAMVSQLNKAVSRTFGQDSDNITASLRKARVNLGDKFEMTLKGNAVKADDEFLSDLASHVDTANKELGSDAAKVIGKQVDEILSKVGKDGAIDGQTAYNLKKGLDRIGDRNSPEAYYARDLKRSLMGALNRSLGPDEAAKFATVRKQYGNMLDVESLAQNGAEGGVSVGRLANLKGVNNPDLKDLADIAAQFVRPRESPHGAAQRVVLGGLGLGGAVAAPAAVPALAGGVAAGRVANTALNSQTLKNLMLGQSTLPENMRRIGGNPALRSLLYVNRRDSQGNQQ